AGTRFSEYQPFESTPLNCTACIIVCTSKGAKQGGPAQIRRSCPRRLRGMHLLKYSDGWTRRHFLEQVARGVAAAGVIAPLWEVIGGTGSLDAAYPPELLSL